MVGKGVCSRPIDASPARFTQAVGIGVHGAGPCQFGAATAFTGTVFDRSAGLSLFGLLWGMNVARGDIRQSSLNRLWGYAVLAQPAYSFALGQPLYALNILFAFAVTGQLLRWLQQPSWSCLVAALLLLTAYLPFSFASYELAGVAMLACSYLLFRLPSGWMMLAWSACVLWLNHAVGGVLMVSGLLGALLLWFVVAREYHDARPRFLPRHFFVGAYFYHLLIIGGVAWLR
nr:TraX family protein [Edwardsiella tarda]